MGTNAAANNVYRNAFSQRTRSSRTKCSTIIHNTAIPKAHPSAHRNVLDRLLLIEIAKTISTTEIIGMPKRLYANTIPRNFAGFRHGVYGTSRSSVKADYNSKVRRLSVAARGSVRQPRRPGLLSLRLLAARGSCMAGKVASHKFATANGLLPVRSKCHRHRTSHRCVNSGPFIPTAFALLRFFPARRGE